jgi:glucose/arabinose dehydrogenase
LPARPTRAIAAQACPRLHHHAGATDLKIPRQTLVLPNGDILIAKGKGGSDAPVMQPKDLIAGYFQSKGTSPVASGDGLTLLRDANSDGT